MARNGIIIDDTRIYIVAKCAPSSTARQFCRRGEWTFASQRELFSIHHTEHGGFHTLAEYGDCIHTHFCLVWFKWGVCSYTECPLSEISMHAESASAYWSSSSILHTYPSSSLQVVRMNPYAALCSHMLSEAIDKLRRGEQTWPPLCVWTLWRKKY